jgi:hypothetical protein
VSADHLSLATMVEVFGPDRAELIVERVGGWTVTVPTEHDLLKALGPELFAAMVHHFGGREVDLPNPPRDTKKAKVITLLEQGVPVNEITRRVNVTGTWVRTCKRMMRGTKARD